MRIIYQTLMILMMTATSFASDSVRYGADEVANAVFSSSTDSGKVVYAYPGEKIQGYADLISHRPQVRAIITQVIVGLNGIGAQDGLGRGNFTLTAPEKPGVYEVRFRYAQAYNLRDAIRYWWSVDMPPPPQSTIGLLIVSNDPENDAKKINDSNWKNWLIQKYDLNHHVADDIEIEPMLTSDMVTGADFWDSAETTGDWEIDQGVFSNKGSNGTNKLVSQKAFENFCLQFTERHIYPSTWINGHARGFGMMYYVSDQVNIAFHYHPDYFLSMVIREGNKYVDYQVKVDLPIGAIHAHEISVENGQVIWKVNGKVYFKEETNLIHGRLMLFNFNHETMFQFNAPNDDDATDDVSVDDVLTADKVRGECFWDHPLTTGKWNIMGNVISNGGTQSWDTVYRLVSKKFFHEFKLKLSEEYRKTKNNDSFSNWAHSRGFAVTYYESDAMSVEFRYFADVEQLSLYITENGQRVEYKQRANFPKDKKIDHDINVKDGQIDWKVNNKTIFQKTTEVRKGRLMLSNHNNGVTFRF